MSTDSINLDTDGFQFSVSGGLNTASARLTMPGEDSPELMNMEVNDNGTLSKRYGFDFWNNSLESAATGKLRMTQVGEGVSYSAGKTAGGSQYIISKDGLDLSMSIIDNTNTLTTRSWTNVWSAQAQQVQPNYVVLNQPDRLRILMLTGKNVPVQLSIVEKVVRYDFGAGGNTIAFPLDRSFANLLSKGFLIINGTIRTISTATIVGDPTNYLNNIVFSGAAVVGVADINIVVPSWQWWAEAVVTRGTWNQMISVKFAPSGSVPTDFTEGYRVVTIPEIMRLGVEETYNAALSEANRLVTRQFPYYVCGGADTNLTSSATYQWVESITGGVASKWTFSDSRFGVTSGRPVAAPNYLQFEAASSTGIIVTRVWEHKWNGNKGGIQAQYYRGRQYSSNLVELDVPISYTGSDVALRIIAPYPGLGAIASSSGDSGARYVCWGGGGTSYNRITAQNTYVYCNTFRSSYVGSAALQGVEFDTWVDGSPYAIGGIQDVANYHSGVFPSCGTVFNNRLVLSGFESAPSTLLISEVADEHVPGHYYKSFQLRYQEGNSADPFDLDVAFQEPDDRILAVREWQNSLWVFSRYRTYRVLPGSSGFISGSVQVQAVGAVGIANHRSVVSGDNSLYFLNNTGVYQLVPAEGLADSYNVQEVSVKIRNQFKNRKYMEQAAFLLYDTIKQRLYAFVPKHQANYCFETYVFFILRQAWAQWSDVRGEGIPAVSGFIYYPDLNTSQLALNMLVHPSRYNSQYIFASDPIAFGAQTKPAYRIGVYPNKFHIDRLAYSTWFTYSAPNLYLDTASANSPFSLNGENFMMINASFDAIANPDTGYREFPVSASKKRYYPGSSPTVYDASGFKIQSAVEIDDVSVGAWDGSTSVNWLTKGVHWDKTNYGSIVIMSNPYTTTHFIVQPKTTQRINTNLVDLADAQQLPRWAYIRYGREIYYDGTPVGPVFGAYEVRSNPYNKLTAAKPHISLATRPATSEPISGATLDQWCFGYLYPSYHKTITMNRGTIANAKKIVRFHGFYDTELATEPYVFYEDLSPLDNTNARRNLGRRLNPQDVTLIFEFNDEYAGVIATDIFNSTDVPYDPAPYQNKEYSRLSVPIFGTGYDFNVTHYNCQASTFTLVGFQIDAKMHPGKQYGRAD